MKKGERTSRRVGAIAGKVLSDERSTKTDKQLAASALAQTERKKKTSPTVAKTAARVLEGGRSKKVAKALAGSVLTQAEKSKVEKVRPKVASKKPARGTTSGGAGISAGGGRGRKK